MGAGWTPDSPSVRIRSPGRNEAVLGAERLAAGGLGMIRMEGFQANEREQLLQLTHVFTGRPNAHARFCPSGGVGKHAEGPIRGKQLRELAGVHGEQLRRIP